MVEAISLSPHYITATALATKTMHTLVEVASKKKEGIFWPHTTQHTQLERTYKPHYDYQNFSPLANGTHLNREKYAILQTHWH